MGKEKDKKKGKDKDKDKDQDNDNNQDKGSRMGKGFRMGKESRMGKGRMDLKDLSEALHALADNPRYLKRVRQKLEARSGGLPFAPPSPPPRPRHGKAFLSPGGRGCHAHAHAHLTAKA